ncbi:ClbS/DfsB family four-helix bundle protein [Leuconostoc gelidum subsp. aenigmaticum]|uniref:ClbS/DfsB family four-helix bundle protein n=1 Tax=Leuconostoc gelidum TaxID=1244 RepID=UPI001CC4785F|nr:ClbS/DfsB family four-helix bundle protein [Leuconostoc gelidum]MBZ6007793.1 ClbS/DfsB family four-helix bundle protein [Leuconostoc gelidum subsp. aenigmaticum]
MQSYSNKEALIQAIEINYKKYIDEFINIPNELKNTRVDKVDRTPSENLSYQLGWITALLNWEKDEIAGKKVYVPAEGYKWNNLGGLYQSFYETYDTYTLSEQINLLNQKVTELCEWLSTLPDDILFEPNKRQWATTNAQWPVWKWVHINSVAPFKTFRTKIRQWKKSLTNLSEAD